MRHKNSIQRMDTYFQGGKAKTHKHSKNKPLYTLTLYACGCRTSTNPSTSIVSHISTSFIAEELVIWIVTTLKQNVTRIQTQANTPSKNFYPSVTASSFRRLHCVRTQTPHTRKYMKSSTRYVYDANNVRTSNMDSVRLFFAVDSLHAYMNTNVWDAVSVLVFVLYFFPSFVFDVVLVIVTLIHNMFQDIIFSHGVPALRTELFCDRVASKIF